MNTYRKELKFIVSDATLLDVRNRICGIMRPDRHQDGDHYRIRSVYFDDSSHSCYYENAAGATPRRKYRIRTYNCDRELIRAEIKTNYRSAVSKESIPITNALYDALVSCDRAEIAADLTAVIESRRSEGDEKSAHVLSQYLAVITAKNFRPACIVDYERSAYVYPVANVRITFDRNVTASDDLSRMFDPSLTGRCALSGMRHILEIKYDEFLPDEIRSLLSGIALRRESCSKYTLSVDALSNTLIPVL